jgi:hypothetical protein
MPPNTYSNLPVEANPWPCLAVMPSMVRLVQLTTVSLVGSNEYRSSWFPVTETAEEEKGVMKAPGPELCWQDHNKDHLT